MIHTVLTIAGSDPSGGAGIQADLRTCAKLNVHGMAVIVALTAQNSTTVSGIFNVPDHVIALQLDAVLPEIEHDSVVKTGMLGTAAIVRLVADKLKAHRIDRLVIDPVMTSTSGRRLLERDATEVLKSSLMPLCTLITPNLVEAEELTGVPVNDIPGMEHAARRLHELGARNVLLKGGHLSGGDAVDVLFDGEDLVRLRAPRIATTGVRGTGCILSSAIAAYMAKGALLADAVRLGKEFVTQVIAGPELGDRGSR